MKKHLLLAAATLLGFSSVFAQDTTPSDGSEKETLYGDWKCNTVYRARLNPDYKYLYYDGTNIVAGNDASKNPNDGAFTPDRLWYFEYVGTEDGKVKVKMHSIACPEEKGVTLPHSDNNALATISDDPTVFYAVENTYKSKPGDCFSLQHPNNASCHVNSQGGYFSTWTGNASKNISSQHNQGSAIYLYELNPEDFEAASWEQNGVTYPFDKELLEKAKDERTPENFRALFSTDVAKIVDVTFNYPKFGKFAPNPVTVQAIPGTELDVAKTNAPDFFKVAKVEESDDEYTFKVEGSWEFPFIALNRVFRADLRKSANVRANYDCTKWTVKDNTICSRNNTNADDFAPENLFYFNGHGFDKDNRLLVTLHTIVLDLDKETKDYGYECASAGGSKGKFSDKPTEWVVKTNSTGDGISLQHPDNEIGHASDMDGDNGMAGTIGIWSHAKSQNDPGSFIRFFALTDSDFETTEWEYNGETYQFKPGFMDAVKANPTPDNVRNLFDINNNTTQLGEINAERGNAGMVYDLQGRRLAAPVRGINIIDGKKVLLNR